MVIVDKAHDIKERLGTHGLVMQRVLIRANKEVWGRWHAPTCETSEPIETSEPVDM